MHLVYRALEGDPVPLTLHGKLIPPSKRKLKLSSSAPSSPSPKGLTPPSVSSSVLSTVTVSFILNQWIVILSLGPEIIYALPSPPQRIGQSSFPPPEDWSLEIPQGTWWGVNCLSIPEEARIKLKFLNLWDSENHFLFSEDINALI